MHPHESKRERDLEEHRRDGWIEQRRRGAQLSADDVEAGPERLSALSTHGTCASSRIAMTPTIDAEREQRCGDLPRGAIAPGDVGDQDEQQHRGAQARGDANALPWNSGAATAATIAHRHDRGERQGNRRAPRRKPPAPAPTRSAPIASAIDNRQFDRRQREAEGRAG